MITRGQLTSGVSQKTQIPWTRMSIVIEDDKGTQVKMCWRQNFIISNNKGKLHFMTAGNGGIIRKLHPTTRSYKESIN